MIDVTELSAKLIKLQSSARGDRMALPFTDVTEVHQITWCEPNEKQFRKFADLEDVKAELDNWLPIGKVDDQCLMVARAAPHRVAVFMEDFWAVADDVQTFFSTEVLAKDEKSAGQKLERALDQAEKKLEKEKPAEALPILIEALRNYSKAPDPDRDQTSNLEELIANTWHCLGYAAHEAGDEDLSFKAYTHAYAWGNLVSAANILLIHLDAKRYQQTIDGAKALLKEFSRKIPIDEESSIRSRLILGLLHLGKAKDVEAVLTDYVGKSDKSERKDLLRALTEDLPEHGFAAHLELAKKLLK